MALKGNQDVDIAVVLLSRPFDRGGYTKIELPESGMAC